MVDMVIKGMLWIENYKAVYNNTKFLPPIGIALDLTDKCNINCYWCNAKKFRSENTLTYEHVKNVINMLSKMGVKSICYAGGGEPTLHPDVSKIIRYTWLKNIEIGFSTNGVKLTDELIDTICKYVKFIGVSVDAATEETWRRTKGSKEYYKMIFNMKKLGEKIQHYPADYTYKFLLTLDNQYEILEACKLAKELKCKSFFIRPVNIEGYSLKFDIEAINKQLIECENLVTENFKLYTNFGRTDKQFNKKQNFTKCYANVLLPVFCADGYVYICPDHRQNEKYRLCKHLDLIKFWGSKQHRILIENIKPTECPRCTLGNYNQQAEAYFKDTIFKNFP